MTTHPGLFDADFSEPRDAGRRSVAPPRLEMTGRVVPPPPRLVIKRRGIPVKTKLFALFVLCVVFWVVGHFVLSQLMTVQASAPITPIITMPATQGGSTSQAASTAYTIRSRTTASSSTLTRNGRAEQLRLVVTLPHGAAVRE